MAEKILRRLKGKRKTTLSSDEQIEHGTSGLQPVTLPAQDTGDKEVPEFNEVCNVDFVAVHGLNGDLWSTWQHEDGTFWLRDLLLTSFTGSRVWTYGYPAQVLDALHGGTIRNHAQRLLQQIRTCTNADPRPIIFICHSLGGIIAKQAIIDAPDFAKELEPRFKGIMFLGTPHRGSDSANVGTRVADSVNLAARLSTIGLASSPIQAVLLRQLRSGSTALREIHDTFRKRATRLQISSFFETKQTVVKGKSLGIIVSEESGVTGLEHEDSYPTVRSHATICRYSKERKIEELWPDVHRHLRDMAGLTLEHRVPEAECSIDEVDHLVMHDGSQEQANRTPGALFTASGKHASPHGRSEDIQVLLKSLAFGEMHAREYRIKNKARGSRADAFDWLLSIDGDGEDSDQPYSEVSDMNLRFQRWLRGETQSGLLFWISGKAASGKSTLMHKICHDPRVLEHIHHWTLGEPVKRAQVFFTDEGTHLQRSWEGLLRSIVYQLLSTDPMLTTSVLGSLLDDALRNGTFDRGKIDWSWDTLCDVLSSITDQASSTCRFLFFIDGLDEFNSSRITSSPSHRRHINSEEGRQIRKDHLQISHFLRDLANNGKIKICVSSRPYNEFETTFIDCPRIQLHLLTATDMRAYVQTQLERYTTHVEDSSCKRYVDAITQKASGVWLWVTIVTDMFVDDIINGMGESRLVENLNALPADLGGPQGLYMKMIERLDSPIREQAWRMFSLFLHARPQIKALYLAFAFSGDIDEALSSAICKWDERQIRAESQRLDKKLKRYGGILELHDGDDVRFIHLTAREFLLSEEIQDRLRANMTSPVPDEHVALLASCILQLKRGVPAGKREMGVWTAIKHALVYARRAEITTGMPQTDLLDELDRTVTLLRESHTYEDVESFRAQGCSDVNFRKSNARHQCHWISCQPHEPMYMSVLWRDDFMSVAVQTNMVLYLEEKLQNGYALSEKQGRPLLAYALIPRVVDWHFRNPGSFEVLGLGLSCPSMTNLLLEWGADPNAVYAKHNTRRTRKGRRQSIWQLTLASFLSYYRGTDTPYVGWTRLMWLENMKLLVIHGANPNAMVRFTRFPEQGTVCKHCNSALFLCIILCFMWFHGDLSLPEMLIERGGTLRKGEVIPLRNWLQQLSGRMGANAALHLVDLTVVDGHPPLGSNTQELLDSFQWPPGSARRRLSVSSFDRQYTYRNFSLSCELYSVLGRLIL